MTWLHPPLSQSVTSYLWNTLWLGRHRFFSFLRNPRTSNSARIDSKNLIFLIFNPISLWEQFCLRRTPKSQADDFYFSTTMLPAIIKIVASNEKITAQKSKTCIHWNHNSRLKPILIRSCPVHFFSKDLNQLLFPWVRLHCWEEKHQKFSAFQ